MIPIPQVGSVACTFKIFSTLKITNLSSIFNGGIGFIRSNDKRCNIDDESILAKFIPLSDKDSDLITARNNCEEYCLESSVCWGCSISCQNQCTWNAIRNCDSVSIANNTVSGGVTQKPGWKIIHLLYTECYLDYRKYINHYVYRKINAIVFILSYSLYRH